MKRLERTLLALATTSLLGACSLAPDYKKPDVPVAEHYKDVGPWTTAQPADNISRDGWWHGYNDARLDRLQVQLNANNADLAAALAHYRQAAAYQTQIRAGLFPTLSVNGNPQRDRESDTKPLRGATSPSNYNSFTLGAQVDYEVDLWGRVRDGVYAGDAQFFAAGADLASARLSLQAQLADNVIALSGLDRQLKLLGESIDAYNRALQLTQTRHEGGIASGLDVARAQTVLSTAKSQLKQTQAQRELTEHAIAVLVGDSASHFELPVDTTAINLPAIPLGLPSALLQRRPDVAAAERRTAAANAQVGVARAAFFPQINLSAQGGYQSDTYGGLLSTANRFWAIGPAIALTVFDGGRRKAGVEAAKAATDEAGARYKGIVLNAFSQVEDAQSQLADFGVALTDQQQAADAAQKTLDLSMERYKEGAVNYLDVVTAQTAALDAQRTLIDLQTRQLRASVQLVKALGGGWSTDDVAMDQRIVLKR
jgi:NodT family efflux transporter outer membrane factor (OMF) lipoprotein